MRSSRRPARDSASGVVDGCGPKSPDSHRAVWGLISRPPVFPSGFLRFPGCPPGSSPSSAFLWFPFVRRPPVRSLRPLPGSGSPSVSLRVPFPLSNTHVSAAAGRFRRRRSQAAGTKVTSSAATTSPGSRDPPALSDGQRLGTMGCRHRIAGYERPPSARHRRARTAQNQRTGRIDGQRADLRVTGQCCRRP